MSEKIYCGSGRIVNTQFGDLTKISFHKDDINKLVSFLREDGGDWVNLALKAKREPAPGKPTHYLEIDQWKPNQESAPAQAQAHPQQNHEPLPDELTPDQQGSKQTDLPF